MTPPSTAPTAMLKQFGLTTAAEELLPRLTQAGHHDARRSAGRVKEPHAVRCRARAGRGPPQRLVCAGLRPDPGIARRQTRPRPATGAAQARGSQTCDDGVVRAFASVRRRLSKSGTRSSGNSTARVS